MKKILFVVSNDKQMTEPIMITVTSGSPFGILSNTELSIHDGSMTHPSVEHYVMANLLKDGKDRIVLASFGSIDEAQSVFNRLDEKQFLRLLHEACNKFHEKKVRSVAKSGNSNKTLGAQCREFLRDASYVFYDAQGMPMPTTVGGVVSEDRLLGYDVVGHSLMRMKRLLRGVEIPEGLELVFWKMNPAHEDIQPLTKKELEIQYKEVRNPKATLRIMETDVPAPRNAPHKRPTATALRKEKGDTSALIMREEIVEEDDEDDFLADLEMMRGDEGGSDSEHEATDDEEDGEVLRREEQPEEPALPDPVVPIYTGDGKKKKVRWVPTHIGPRIDDLREFGAAADMLYTKLAQPQDPFQKPDPLNTRTDPMRVFKIFKAVEHLVSRMHNGYDILVFQNNDIDTILWKCGILPEIFSGHALSAPQKHQIFIECWDRFKSKTLSYYEFVELEILYPGNLVGFIRKAYAPKLNFFIGQKIKDILFRSFLHQVMDKSFPDVSPDMRTTAILREWRGFTHMEFEEITGELYHLFFAGNFMVGDEEKSLIHNHESQRITQHEIDIATAFTPITTIPSGAADVSGTILAPLHPVQLTIDGKVFHDLYQYIFFMIYQVYGGVSAHDAYEHLQQGGKLLKGDDPLLSQRLSLLVGAHRRRLMEEGMKLKLAQHTQVEELILYLTAMGKKLRFLEPRDEETPGAWSKIPLSTENLKIMSWVVSFVKDDLPQHLERCIFLFFFLHDLLRSMGLFSRLMGGEKLTTDRLQSFLHCFYKHLVVIASSDDHDDHSETPAFFSYAVRNILSKKDVSMLWSVVQAFADKLQTKTISPMDLFSESKKMSRVSMEDTIRALTNVLRCLYKDMDKVSNDDLHTIVMIMSGRDNVAPWMDPVSEMVMERETSNMPRHINILPKDIRDKIPVKKGTKSKDVVELFMVHPDVDVSLLLKELERPTSRDPLIARTSHAVAALHKNMLHPRRVMFYV